MADCPETTPDIPLEWNHQPNLSLSLTCCRFLFLFCFIFLFRFFSFFSLVQNWEKQKEKTSKMYQPDTIIEIRRLYYMWCFHLHRSQEGTSGKTALHFAVELHDIASVKLLLSRGANVDTAMFNGCTPLHLAVGRQDTAIANLLCQSGADTMLRNMEGDTALDLADGNDDVS